MTGPAPDVGDMDTLRAFAQGATSAAYDEIAGSEDQLAPRAWVIADAVTELLLLPAPLMVEPLTFGPVLDALLPHRVEEREARALALTFPIRSPYHKSIERITLAERRAAARGEIPDGWPANRDEWARPEEQMLALFTAGGQELWWARIVRIQNQGPQLGFWTTLAEELPAQRRMFASIRDALAQRGAPASPRA
jgi:hypothetical protein